MITARQLIQQSYRDAQLIAETGETVQQFQFNSALVLLNRIIRRINITGFIIPLVSEESFNFTPGDEELFLPGWSDVIMFQYYLGDVLVKIPLERIQTYYEIAVIRNNTGVGIIGWKKRVPTGIILKSYFTPDEARDVEIRGTKSLPELTLDDSIDTDTIEFFVADYIGYLLSIDLQMAAQFDRVSQFLIAKKNEYEKQFKKLKNRPIQRKFDMLSDNNSSNTLAAYNLGGGWRP